MRNSSISEDIIAVVKKARQLGYKNEVIASYYVMNQGRVAEVNTGRRGATVQPAAQLPSDFPALA